MANAKAVGKESVEMESVVVHRKATWCTRIGDHILIPGYNKFTGTKEDIKDIKESSTWESELSPNPLYNGRPNMVEIIVENESDKETFASTIKAMKTEEAVELIGHHGDIEDIREAMQLDKRKAVKGAAKLQIENLNAREKK